MSIENITEEEAVSMLTASIQAEPESRDILYKTLIFCQTERTAEEIESQINIWTTNRTILHKPQALLSLLIQEGGLLQSKGDEGQIILHTTDAGSKAANTNCPSNRLGKLLSRDTDSCDIYLKIMEACKSGRTLDELEDIVPPVEIVNEDNMLASYFVGELEDAGGLEWNIKWHKTEAGHEALKTSCS